MSNIIAFPGMIIANDATLSAREYARKYTAARRQAARMDLETRRKIAAIYREAADEAANVVKDSLDRGLSELTTERWADIAARLSRTADALASGTEDSTTALIDGTADLLPGVDAQYVLSAASRAGADDITAAGMSRLIAGVHDRVMASLVSRLWGDKQTFSTRIWGGDGVRADWLERMRITISAGIAQGRDPLKIAKDIQVYAADGKVALLQRWGTLERGTAEFAKRIPKNVDWRAVRLVRSELYASLQDSAVLAGRMNPGCDGLFDWVLQAGRQDWNCDCQALADGGPYEADQVPTYPHPNCFCAIVPHLRDQSEFVSDLARWAKGEDVDYLDKWYAGQYKAAA
jgi:hypothetical protein